MSDEAARECIGFAARILRLTLISPGIVESNLMGDEPSGLSLTMLTKQLPACWDEQTRPLGFADTRAFGLNHLSR